MHVAARIVAIACSIGLPLSIPIVFLVLDYRKRGRLMELHHAERMAAIERGMEIPPLPADVLGWRRTGCTTLLPGLIFLFVGLALLLGLYGSDAPRDALLGLSLWGLVPTAVGLACLTDYVVEGRKTAAPKDKPEERRP